MKGEEGENSVVTSTASPRVSRNVLDTVSTASATRAATDFRKEITKLMPGYQWTVHRGGPAYLEATGIQSSGFNRLSTLSITRRDRGGAVEYEVKSAGYGTRAPWLATNSDGTLARALRGLQQHYEAMANNYRRHAADLQAGRAATPDRLSETEGSSREATLAAQRHGATTPPPNPPRTT